MEDITQQTIKEQAIQYRLDFENLIINLSEYLPKVPPSKSDEGVNYVLQKIGEFSGVDRSYVFVLSEDKKITHNTHEWCRTGIKPQKDNLQNLPMDIVPWWMKKLDSFETIYIPNIEKLPMEAQAEKEMLEQQDIKSVVGVPLIRSRRLVGFMGFDSVRKYKQWSNGEIVLLKIVAQLIVNYLNV